MSTVQAPVTTCPKCKSKEPWGENSWCPACGYYPKFASQIAEPPTIDPETDVVEPMSEEEHVSENALGNLPQWMWIMGAGVLAIILFSAGVRAWIHFNGGRRAFFALGEMLLGFVSVGGASIFAWKQCRKGDQNLSLANIVTNPIYIWQPTLEHMPETRKRLWFLAWGITMIITSNLIIGGIKYSGIYTNDWGFKQPKRNLLAEGASQLGGMGKATDKDLLEELEEYKEKKAAGLPAEPPKVDVVVYGVLADEHLEMGRILVARRRKGLLSHAAVLRGSDLEEEDYTVLERRVSENLTEEPAVASFLNAIWVKPIINLKLTFEDMVGGELVEPRFHSIERFNKKTKEKKEELEADAQGKKDEPQADGANEGDEPEENTEADDPTAETP